MYRCQGCYRDGLAPVKWGLCRTCQEERAERELRRAERRARKYAFSVGFPCSGPWHSGGELDRHSEVRGFDEPVKLTRGLWWRLATWTRPRAVRVRGRRW